MAAGWESDALGEAAPRQPPCLLRMLPGGVGYSSMRPPHGVRLVTLLVELGTSPTGQEIPGPGREAQGHEPVWGRWLPTVWRAVNDDTGTITLPPRPPSDHIDTAAWWSPLLHLALYSFAWPDPAPALDNWDRAGRPLDDPRFSLIDAIWGRHLDVMLHHLWTNRPTFLPEGRDLGWSPIRKRPDVPTAVARHELRASWSVPNPSSGGSDSLHLSGHVYSALCDHDQREPEDCR